MNSFQSRPAYRKYFAAKVEEFFESVAYIAAVPKGEKAVEQAFKDWLWGEKNAT